MENTRRHPLHHFARKFNGIQGGEKRSTTVWMPKKNFSRSARRLTNRRKINRRASSSSRPLSSSSSFGTAAVAARLEQRVIGKNNGHRRRDQRLIGIPCIVAVTRRRKVFPTSETRKVGGGERGWNVPVARGTIGERKSDDDDDDYDFNPLHSATFVRLL